MESMNYHLFKGAICFGGYPTPQGGNGRSDTIGVTYIDWKSVQLVSYKTGWHPTALVMCCPLLVWNVKYKPLAFNYSHVISNYHFKAQHTVTPECFLLQIYLIIHVSYTFCVVVGLFTPHLSPSNFFPANKVLGEFFLVTYGLFHILENKY